MRAVHHCAVLLAVCARVLERAWGVPVRCAAAVAARFIRRGRVFAGCFLSHLRFVLGFLWKYAQTHSLGFNQTTSFII